MTIQLRNIAIIIIIFLPGKYMGQNIVDQCFYSVDLGADFGGSGDISNSGGDISYFNGNSWSPVAFGVQSPYPGCNDTRAIRLNSASDPNDVAGFRLTGGMTAGNVVGFNLKVLKLSGNFNLGIYSRGSGQFYDGGDIQANVITNQNANYGAWTEISISFTVPANSQGNNWIFLRAENGEGIIGNFCQVGISPPDADLGPDEDLCDGETLTLDLTSPSSWYEWSTGSTEAVITPGYEGNFTGTIYNACGSDSDDIYITVHEEPELNVTADTIVCAGSIVVLEAPGWNANYVWNDGSTESSLTVDSAGIYSVQITDDCFNTSDEIEITYLDPPEVDLGPDSVVCGGTVDYYVANGGPTSTYSWNTGVESPGISITETGNYSVTITNMCGAVSDDVYVEFSYGPGDFLPYTQEFCEGKPMTIDLSYIEGSFEWSDGQTDAIFEVPNPGWHYVTIVDDDSCFVATDTVEVRRIFCDCPVFLANSFTPNGDGYNEEYNIIFDCVPYNYELTIYDRWGQSIFWSNDTDKIWDGRNSNGRLLPTGVYHYVLRYSIQYQGPRKLKRGTVTLIKD